jgi:F5/8 type C domain-containing protein
MMARLILLFLVLAGCGAPENLAPEGGLTKASLQPEMLERIADFEAGERWRAVPASGVQLQLAIAPGRTGQALRADFDFRGGGGWAALRREMQVQLPENYELSFWLKGEAPLNTLELKLIDASGENVWWINRPEFEFQGDWRRVTFRKRHVKFAWGPARGGEIRALAAIEFAITAGTGGRGTVWLDDFTLTPLEPVLPYDAQPVVRAAGAAGALMDGDTTSVWRSAGTNAQTIEIDFTRNREFGGLVVHWQLPHRAADFDVRLSRDRQNWQTVRRVRAGDRARDYLQLPESESRFVRLHLLRDGNTADCSPSRSPACTATFALREISVMPLEWGESRNRMYETMAEHEPRGSFPKYFSKLQSYWTVVGVNGDDREGLLNEEGMLEVDRRAFSIEPFLFTDGRLITWSDARITQALEHDYLPIPSVQWDAGDLRLTVTSWADGDPGSSVLWARYRVENRSPTARPVTLFLALQPYQVNPSWQFLNNPGGAARVRNIAFNGARVTIDSTRAVIPVTAPTGFGATTFDRSYLSVLRRNQLYGEQRINDAEGGASAALSYALELPAGATGEVYIALPWHAGSVAPPAGLAQAAASELGRARLSAAAASWTRELGSFQLTLPASAARISNSIRSNLAYILINRDRAALQPGSRSYERSWIRDGSLTSAAMLRLGHAAEVRGFIDWFAPFQYQDGKVPCCVDQRGADPVPENDSHGQLIYLMAEYLRHTGDRALVERHWQHVERAVRYLDSLRHSRRTPEYQTAEKRAFFGLLPQSISHEGYSEKPMHSYWDDFFAVKGFEDAAYLAGVLGKPAEQQSILRSRDEFRRDLLASFELAMRNHGIDFLPGSVELGDFDATSTTVGLNPASEQEFLPQAALRQTFNRYWENFERRAAAASWESYTPYEWRVVGSLLRLGEKKRAHALIDWFFEHQRPAAWNHWGEVVFRDPATPRFIGDMPHTWVGSDFIRSMLDLFAYERTSDRSLMIGAGIVKEWIAAGDSVKIAGLSTHYGRLGYTMKQRGSRVLVTFAGELRPPGGIVVLSPLEQPIRAALADGRTLPTDGTRVRLPRTPRELLLQY